MKCAACGEEHNDELMELTCYRPDVIAGMNPALRALVAKESGDICAVELIEGGARRIRYFLRCLLPLPVQGRKDPYNLGVWAEVSEDDFTKIYALWDDPHQDQVPSFYSTLANEILFYPSSLGQMSDLKLTGPETRPILMLHDRGHALSNAQICGIDEHQAQRFSSLLRQVVASAGTRLRQ